MSKNIHGSELPRQQAETLESPELTELNQEYAKKQHETLENAKDKHDEKKRHEQLAEARRDADNTALNREDTTHTETFPAKRRGIITKHQRDISFDKQLSAIQPALKPAERVVSKIIHNKVVEKTSDSLAATIARPNALLAGSISAFIIVTIVYLGAKHFGYPLSGFETIAAFAIGWILGLVYDYLKLLASGK